MGYFSVRGLRENLRAQGTGQLELMIAGVGIEQQRRNALGRRDVPAELASLHATQIFDLAQNGDPATVEVVTATAAILADAIFDIALLLDPETVVLSGGLGSHPDFCQSTQAFLDRRKFAQPLLHSSSLGTQAQLQRAVSLSMAAAEFRLLL